MACWRLKPSIASQPCRASACCTARRRRRNKRSACAAGCVAADGRHVAI
jgi:hypothetical protein